MQSFSRPKEGEYCRRCKSGILVVRKNSERGNLFLGCSNYSTPVRCNYTLSLYNPNNDQSASQASQFATQLTPYSQYPNYPTQQTPNRLRNAGKYTSTPTQRSFRYLPYEVRLFTPPVNLPITPYKYTESREPFVLSSGPQFHVVQNEEEGELCDAEATEVLSQAAKEAYEELIDVSCILSQSISQHKGGGKPKIAVMLLCDGISAGQLALEKAEISEDVVVVYASEIDENRRKVTLKNFPNTIHITNDVLQITYDDILNLYYEIKRLGCDRIYFAGGPPCPPLSPANRNAKAFEDPRADVFVKVVQIKNWFQQLIKDDIFPSQGPIPDFFYTIENVVPKYLTNRVEVVSKMIEMI
jgi:hypothetical protein